MESGLIYARANGGSATATPSGSCLEGNRMRLRSQRSGVQLGVEASHRLSVVQRPDDQVAVVGRRDDGGRSQQRHAQNVLVVRQRPLREAVGASAAPADARSLLVVARKVRVDAHHSVPTGC